MPALKNPRHERVARAVAAGQTPTEACTEAGYVNAAAAAHRLAADRKVQARVTELADPSAAARMEMSLPAVTRRLMEIAGKGEAGGQAAGLSVARAAVMDAAKLNGLVVDKSVVKAEVEVVDGRERLAALVAREVAAQKAGQGSS
ncbi:MAG: hypothetical protein ABIO37_10460 [Caulobacteraceae bacterium]